MAEHSISKTLKIENKLGLHARPAALLVKAAAKYEADIFVEKDGNTVSCKSIMGLMTIEGYPGSKLKVTATGGDAQEALAEIEELFAKKFYED